MESDLEGVSTETDLVRVRSAYLGKKGSITALLKSLRDIPPETRREAGSLVNAAKTEAEEIFSRRSDEIRRKAR